MHQLQQPKSSIATNQQKCFHCHRIKLVDNRKANLPVTPYSPVDRCFEVGNGRNRDSEAWLQHCYSCGNEVCLTDSNIRNKVMKNQCGDYSYFSLNALSYLTTLLVGIAFGLSIAIVVLHMSENIYQIFHHLIYLIVSLVIAAIVCRGITLYFWSRKNNEQLPTS